MLQQKPGFPGHHTYWHSSMLGKYHWSPIPLTLSTKEQHPACRLSILTSPVLPSAVGFTLPGLLLPTLRLRSASGRSRSTTASSWLTTLGRYVDGSKFCSISSLPYSLGSRLFMVLSTLTLPPWTARAEKSSWRLFAYSIGQRTIHGNRRMKPVGMHTPFMASSGLNGVRRSHNARAQDLCLRSCGKSMRLSMCI
ncbi:hypothetical protein BD289DRAFT_238596 [Coniella lustricola]|uniref:Uncharacterized protein n=1 Tax=Coniella lustricola TaxID=2025994 RepID=A0A2T3AL60_9PEZI|nr:hypothetical protein BD289DRAFT_238596 [Coniella lustricola]